MIRTFDSYELMPRTGLSRKLTACASPVTVDAESQSIYCYGGSDGSLSGPYSGLFRYDIKSRTWTQLLYVS